MQCDEFARMIDNYDNLTEEEILKLNEHSLVCESCRKELEFTVSVMSTLRTLPEIEVPGDFLASLNEKIDAEEKKNKNVLTHIKWQRFSALAACLVLVAVIGVNRDYFENRLNKNDDDFGVISEVVVTPQVKDDTSEADVEIISEENNEAVEEKEGEQVEEIKPQAKEIKAEKKQIQSNASVGDSSVKRESKVVVTDEETYVRIDVVGDGRRYPVSGISATQTPTVVVEPEEAKVSMKEEITPATIEATPQVVEEQSQTYAIAPASELPENSAESVYSLENEAGESYAVASEPMAVNEIEDTSNQESEAYMMYADSLLMISAEDYDEAVGIIANHISGSYSNYYFMELSSLEGLRSDLHNAEIEFEDYMSDSSEQITFRVIKY